MLEVWSRTKSKSFYIYDRLSNEYGWRSMLEVWHLFRTEDSFIE